MVQMSRKEERKMRKHLSCVAVLVVMGFVALGSQYNENPSPANLAARRLFRERAYGLFIHYGLFSVSGVGECQCRQDCIPPEKYIAERLPFFKPKADCVDEWIRLAKDAGMNYIVLTTRHLEGYFLGDRFLKEYADKVRASGLGVGFYFSVPDYQDPGYGAGPREDRAGWDRYVAKTKALLLHLMKDFGRIDYLFYDGCPPPSEWNVREVNAEIRRLQPQILMTRCGEDEDFLSCEQHSGGGHELWESCYTLNNTWGYGKYDTQWKEPWKLAWMFFTMRHNGGNLLLNVGPMADGTVQEEAASRLRALGRWVKANAAAIYDVTPHPFDYKPQELIAGDAKDPTVVYLLPSRVWSRPEKVVRTIGNKVLSVTRVDNGKVFDFVQDEKEHLLVIRNPDPLLDGEMPYILKLKLDGKPFSIRNRQLPQF